MPVQLSSEDEAFRDELCEWLEANLAPEARKVGSLRSRLEREPRVAFYKALSGRGWIAPAWPREHGGAGFTLTQQVIFGEELGRLGAPAVDAGISLAGPLIIEFGTEAQKQRFLPKMVSADEMWCQGYSEPNAGSDLAALATRAEIDGDSYIINGQKIWTSMAYQSDWIFMLVRTNPGAKKQEGISFLLVDMKSPGIRVNRIRQITDESDFCETWFDHVRVPRDNLVGQPNEGWTYAKQILEFERAGALVGYPLRRSALRLKDYLNNHPNEGLRDMQDPEIRQRLAQTLMDADAYQYLGYRTLTRLLQGKTPGSQSSIRKLFASESIMRLGALATDALGPHIQYWHGETTAKEDFEWPLFEVSSRHVGIHSGTSEIQRNIISERVLGLPREQGKG